MWRADTGETTDRICDEAINVARTAEQERETVGITNHATDRTDGGDKAKCRLPDSVIENVVLQRKGRQYLDLEEESIHFSYNATVIVADYDSGQNEWTVITVYRDPNAEAKRRKTRYREITVNEIVHRAQKRGLAGETDM